MPRLLLRRVLALWLAFGLGGCVGVLITNHYLGKCETRIVELDTDALENAVQAALPTALTGSGMISIIMEPTGIRVHADSIIQTQSYDTRILAVVRGSPATVDISTQIVRRLLSR